MQPDDDCLCLPWFGKSEYAERSAAAPINSSAKSCPVCGAIIKSVAPGKSRVTAVILALLLRGFGVHKFYLGATTLGIIYLFLCWTYIPMLISLVERVVYLCTSDESFAEKYMKQLKV
jgi:TM2 domain-containing membrane protein YozV